MSTQNETQTSYSRWLTEDVFKLIELVRSDEAIYNPRHKYYFCRPYVENFWREVDLRLLKNPGASLAKWTNLRISFRREYTTYQEEKVPPCWSYFDKMFFLHPYLRNKKQSGPKDVESHIQEAIAQINSINYNTMQTAAVSPVNECVDHYLSYCEDDPQPSLGMDDIIEEEDDNDGNCNLNSIKNEIKSECDNENDNREDSQEQDNFKDLIVEISDDAESTASTSGYKRQTGPGDVANRSFIKRCRAESAAPAAPSNISLVRPMAMVPVPTEPTGPHHSAVNASLINRIPSAPSSPARRNDFCECKTDSDAMFLMSLLPDIRKLHGRDRGKIKIAFQNILQEFLYPD